jgi:chromate transporter
VSEARPSLRELCAYFAKLGWLAFGGPVAQIGLMHLDCVERRRWIGEDEFVRALNFCHVLPGPEALQLAIYIGFKQRSYLGGLLAGLLFIFPGYVTLAALAAVYVHYGSAGAVLGVLWGFRPVALALIAAAMWRIGKAALRSWEQGVLAVLAFAAFHFGQVSFIAVLAACGAAYWLLQRGRRAPPVAAVALPFLPDWGRRLAGVSWFFLKVGLVSFGGAYAALPYMRQAAVQDHGWLTDAQMIDGLALGETTPGPLISIGVFVGFLAGQPLGVPWLSATAAAFWLFLPSFAFVLAGAPYVDALTRRPGGAGGAQGDHRRGGGAHGLHLGAAGAGGVLARRPGGSVDHRAGGGGAGGAAAVEVEAERGGGGAGRRRAGAPGYTAARMISSIVLCAALAAAAPAEPVEGPVAVLSFKNLNADPKTDWLKAGIAETMISDLRRSGRVQVVERSQVDRAIAEIALQAMKAGGAAPGEEANAAKVGKLVGAKTIVIGTFQQAGKQLRINARFVAVETGVVRGAAKVTGALDGVFGLQDQIVASLLGETAPPARRPRPKTRGVEAYRLYAMSLTTASDAEKVDYLRRSLEVDPMFVYAKEDLEALQKRMAGYSEASSVKNAEQEGALDAKVRDGSLASSARLEAARALLQELTAAKRYHHLAEAAEQLSRLTLPAPDGPALRELASERLVFARIKLKRYDEALQLGEQHLKEFPGGQTYRAVESAMNAVIQQRKEVQARRAEYQSDLDEKRKGAKPGSLEWDFAPCICARWNRQVNELMLDGCAEFLKKRAGDSDPDAKDHVEAARFFIVKALAERGEFEKARAGVKELSDQYARDDELRAMMDDWPAD